MTAKRPHHVHAIRQSDRNATAHAIEVNAPRRPSKWPQAFSANPLPDSSMMEAAPLPPESATTNRPATAPSWNYPATAMPPPTPSGKATAMPPPQAIRRTAPQKHRGDRANGRKPPRKGPAKAPQPTINPNDFAKNLAEKRRAPYPL